MDLILRPSGGQNIVLRPMARPTWYPPATVAAHEAEVFVQHYDPATGALVGAPRSLGRFNPGAEVVYEFNPDEDRNVRVYVVSYAADGTPSVSSLRDAVQADVLFNRVSDAPTITQVGDATQGLLVIAVDDYEVRFARRRRIRVSDNSDMSGAVEVVREAGPGLFPRLEPVTRGEAETDARTVYVTVAHSGGGAYGPESDVLECTFTDDTGSGGSSGGGSEIERGGGLNLP